MSSEESRDRGLRDIPVNEIDRIEGIRMMIRICEVCGESHTHGTGGSIPSVGKKMHRGGHCDENSEYYVVRTDETDVVDRYGNPIEA